MPILVRRLTFGLLLDCHALIGTMLAASAFERHAASSPVAAASLATNT